MQKIVIQTHSAAETMQLAEQMGSLLQAGDCIAYFGGLGAGKTTFTRGLAKGMGLPDEVASPTFAIVNEYHGTGALSLYHFDMYRIIRWRKMYLPLNGQKILQIVCRKIGLQ